MTQRRPAEPRRKPGPKTRYDGKERTTFSLQMPPRLRTKLVAAAARLNVKRGDVLCRLIELHADTVTFDPPQDAEDTAWASDFLDSDRINQITIEVSRGIDASPDDTPEEAAFRARLVPEIAEMTAKGIGIDIPGEWAGIGD